MTFGLDSSFSEDSLIQRINSDLANDLGNLFSRVLSMLHKYFQGIVPKVDPTVDQEIGLGLEADAQTTIVDFERFMEAFQFHSALMAVWKFIGKMNFAPRN